MIPRIIHQTWKTDAIPPRFQAWSESWLRHNPGWTRMFWNDRALLSFVADHYPDFLATFCGYKQGVMRADAARYLLLHHFGGVYADIDCECVASLEPLAAEDRIVLCLEPERHFREAGTFRRLPYLLFNGTIASPKGHPFWLDLHQRLLRNAGARDVLDATGPCLLTAARLEYDDQGAFSINPAPLFSPVDAYEAEVANPEQTPTLSIHHWAGTWYSRGGPPKAWNRFRMHLYRARHHLTKGRTLSLDEARKEIDQACLSAAPPSGDALAILVPLRDAADHIGPFLAALDGLDYPKERIKLVFCEGDSGDGSWAKLQAAVEPLRSRYRGIVLLQKHLGSTLDREKRWKPRLQRARRSGIAKVRNHLIAHGLDETDDWALWIDIDVWRFPRDVVQQLIGAGSRIAVPNCVLQPGGGSFDLNSFVTVRPERDHRYYRNIVRGLYQPQSPFPERLFLSDFPHLPRVELQGVGGTMLLVDASLHRGGLRFPDIPYRDLIETEAFGVLAGDLGIIPLGLPQLEILHVPW
jgi:hypothetical protein